MSSLHVGMVLSSLAGGGAERVLLTLAEELLNRGHRVDLLLLKPHARHGEAPSKLGLFFLGGARRRDRALARAEPLWIGPAAAARTWRAIRRRYPRLACGIGNARDALGVARFARRAKPALLLSALPRADAATLLATRCAATPSLVSIHCDVDQNYDSSQRRRAETLLGRAAAVVCVSSALARQVGDRFPLARNVCAIRNGLPLRRVRALAAQPSGHPWLDSPALPVVVAAGRLTAQKDYQTLLGAFATLRASRDVRLVVLGEGPQRRRLAAEARRLNVDDAVDWVGFRRNPYAFMAKANVFALSSIYEGLPTVLIEAMACGTPVVSTDAPFGPSEILEGGRWGPLAAVGDSAGLAKAVDRVLAGDRPSADALRRRSEDFAIERTADEYERLLRQVLEGRERARAPAEGPKDR